MTPVCIRSPRAGRHAIFMQARHSSVTGGPSSACWLQTPTRSQLMHALLAELAEQRWDDHRFYHHSRINQSLHLVSALCFIAAYGLLFVDPASAALLAWGVSMTTRQAGHFFFEPRGYDQVNQVTDAYKEAVKVGYNIRRKVVLMALWAAAPLLLWVWPSLGGAIEPAATPAQYLHDVGIAWLSLGVAGIAVRVLQLWRARSLRIGLVWALKIVTDPFHDVRMYWRAPLALLRDERIDPMQHVRRD
jgi:hypothetical protein